MGCDCGLTIDPEAKELSDGPASLEDEDMDRIGMEGRGRIPSGKGREELDTFVADLEKVELLADLGKRGGLAGSCSCNLGPVGVGLTTDDGLVGNVSP